MYDLLKLYVFMYNLLTCFVDQTTWLQARWATNRGMQLCAYFTNDFAPVMCISSGNKNTTTATACKMFYLKIAYTLLHENPADIKKK